jgi:hypothetical protein
MYGRERVARSASDRLTASESMLFELNVPGSFRGCGISVGSSGRGDAVEDIRYPRRLKDIPAYMKEDPPDLLSTFDLASTSQRNALQPLQRSGLFRRPPSWDRLSRLCPIWRVAYH